MLTNSYSVNKLDCVQMMGHFLWEPDILSDFDAVEKHLPAPEDGREPVAQLWVTCVYGEQQQSRFSLSKHKSHITLNITACPNGSVAVLLYGLLQKFLFCDRFLPVWLLIIAAETMSLKEKPFEKTPWGT